LLLPIYTRELDPHQYGIFKSLISAGLIVSILVSFQLDFAYPRFFVDYDGDRNSLKTLFSSILWFGTFWGALACIASYFALRRWAVDSLGAKLWPHLAVACAIPYIAKLNLLAVAHFRSRHQSGIVTISSAAGFISGSVLSIVLLLKFDAGVSALLWGALVGPCVSAAWCYLILAREGLIGFVFSFKLLGETLRYSLGILPMAGAAWLAGQADAIFVAEWGTLTESGIYSVAFDIGRLINLIVMSIFMAYIPMIYKMLKEDPARNVARIEAFQAFLIHIMVGMALFLSLLAPEIFAFLVNKQEYHAGIALVPVIAFAFVIGGIRKLHATVMYYHKATLLISIGGILQAVIGVGLNYLLIPRYGPAAAAWAKLVGFAVAAVYVWCLTRKFQPLRFDLRALGITLATVAACLAVVGICQFVLRLSFWPLLAAKIIVMLLALWWTWRSRFGDRMRTVLVRRKPSDSTSTNQVEATDDFDADAMTDPTDK
jgi:O-antigen/teichoic acid export membrane protein